MKAPDLFHQLTDDDETVRAAAREELSMMMDDGIARRYLDIIATHKNEEVVADTIIGLGPIIEEAGLDFDDSDDELDPELGPGISRKTFATILQELRAVYGDEQRPKLVRRRAFEVLVRDPRPWMSEAIPGHFASDDRDWKLTAVFAMGYVPGFDRDLIALVNTAEGELLLEAISSAALREVTEVARRMRELAKSSPDRDVQLAAIQALPQVDPRCEELLEKLARASHRDVAAAARAALEDLAVWAEEEED